MLPLRRPGRRLGFVLATFMGLSLLMALGVTLPLDRVVLRAVDTWRSPGLTAVMQVVTALGSGTVLIPFALILVAVLLWLERPDRARRLFYAGISAELLYVIIKAAFQRPRPDIISRLGAAGWYSYPSGHSMLAVVIWGFGLMLLARSIHSVGGRYFILGIGVVVPLGVAISRVYLGVHYPSDVLGALVLGCAWVLVWREPDSRESKSATSVAPATM